MKVQIRYESNRLDIFDTSIFTKAEPFDGTNMLTNFEVRVDELGNAGLWLIAHFYEVNEAYAKQANEGETPAARRKRGWRFLLAEESELPLIETVNIDGQTTLMRISGELCDMVRFEQMCELWLANPNAGCIARRAVALYDALCQAFPERSADDAAIARLCGFSAEAMDELRERTSTFAVDDSDDNDDWLSDFEDETTYEG